MGDDEFWLMYILRNIKENKVLIPFAIKYLESNLDNLSVDNTLVGMCLLISLKKSEEGEILLDKFIKLGYRPINEDERKTVVTNFIFLMKE